MSSSSRYRVLGPLTGTQTLLAQRQNPSAAPTPVVLRVLAEPVPVTRLPFAHPSIVPLLDVDEVAGQRVAVFDFVPGASLRELVEAHRVANRLMSLSVVVRVVLDAALALQAAQEYAAVNPGAGPFVHGALGDQSVLVGFDGLGRVMDFGARRSSRFLAPESVRGEPIDTRADIFALGALLHACLTNFDKAYAGTLQRAPTPREFPPPSAVHPEASPAIDALVMRAVTVSPEARYGSMLEFIRELEQATAGHLATPEQLAGLVHQLFGARMESLQVLLVPPAAAHPGDDEEPDALTMAAVDLEPEAQALIARARGASPPPVEADALLDDDAPHERTQIGMSGDFDILDELLPSSDPPVPMAPSKAAGKPAPKVTASAPAGAGIDDPFARTSISEPPADRSDPFAQTSIETLSPELLARARAAAPPNEDDQPFLPPTLIRGQKGEAAEGSGEPARAATPRSSSPGAPPPEDPQAPFLPTLVRGQKGNPEGAGELGGGPRASAARASSPGAPAVGAARASSAGVSAVGASRATSPGAPAVGSASGARTSSPGAPAVGSTRASSSGAVGASAGSPGRGTGARAAPPVLNEAQNISLGGDAIPEDDLDEQPTAIRPSKPAIEALRRAAIERGMPPLKPLPPSPDLGEDVPTEAPKRATGARPALPAHGLVVGLTADEKALAQGQEKITTADLDPGEDPQADAARGLVEGDVSLRVEAGPALGEAPEEDTAVRRIPVAPDLPPPPKKSAAPKVLGALLVTAIALALGGAVWLKSQGRWPPPQFQGDGPGAVARPPSGEAVPAPAPGPTPAAPAPAAAAPAAAAPAAAAPAAAAPADPAPAAPAPAEAPAPEAEGAAAPPAAGAAPAAEPKPAAVPAAAPAPALDDGGS